MPGTPSPLPAVPRPCCGHPAGSPPAAGTGAYLDWVSHEVRSPLTVLAGYLEALLDGVGGELGAEQRELLLLARGGAERLTGFAEHLLHGPRT
ncbi:phospho-acceptor domain-containing protein [Motilibacter rhizosphaerae]|uniref:histidine kinase n=1 Tax=Motilibacter rhizosphaerae TaxID=598652 RepID=A0A4Q7NQ80_9ACTN|nr:histidine kinase dimerization/phospho-acceptor domain-containing protein [Motilibacter rhizosphaerae]RZS87471.1 phospho-acceptor domain-containing protein [Motilibacter rhizosphaerae]